MSTKKIQPNDPKATQLSADSSDERAEDRKTSRFARLRKTSTLRSVFGK